MKVDTICDLLHETSPKLAIISTKMSMPLRKTDSWMNSLWSWRSTGWRWRGEKPIAGTPTYEYKVQAQRQKEIHKYKNDNEHSKITFWCWPLWCSVSLWRLGKSLESPELILFCTLFYVCGSCLLFNEFLDKSSRDIQFLLHVLLCAISIFQGPSGNITQK